MISMIIRIMYYIKRIIRIFFIITWHFKQSFICDDQNSSFMCMQCLFNAFSLSTYIKFPRIQSLQINATSKQHRMATCSNFPK